MRPRISAPPFKPPRAPVETTREPPANEATVNRRREERKKKRITCEILVGDQVQRGIVLDVSSGGLFVQTGATLTLGAEVEVHISPSSGTSNVPTLFIRTVVARKQLIDRRLSNNAKGGVGLRIEVAPPAFYEYFGIPDPSQAEAEAAAEPTGDSAEGQSVEEGGKFRVRVGRGPRSYWLTSNAETEDEALSWAVQQAGSDWEALEIELL